MLPDVLASLLLVDISEPSANSLRLVALEMSPQGESIENVDGIISRPILPTAGKQAIEILWASTITYVVLNESYAIFRRDLPKPTKNLEQVDDPVFEALIANMTFATKEFPGPFKTWRFHAENHLVLVASLDQPLDSAIDVEAGWLSKPGPSLFQA